ncbi:uncharacterized protein LOC143291210 [Babylonia areolata]|uniref:uncharacterized protein LOC143291210 n=1 Tax=Babylonia areolata TaxID=304850 RepID=UPI003FD4E762
MAAMAANSTATPSSLTATEVQAAEVTKLWPAILYTSLLMVMGFLGNSVVCYVYGFRWQSTVTKIFIFSLAALDLTNSLICMPTEIAMLVRIVTFDAPTWCKITRFLTYTLNGSSSLILVAIAFDRWYKVCRPLKCFFTRRRAKFTCLGALVLAASISWPSLVLYGNLALPIVGSDTMGVTCLVSDDFIDTWWPLVFYCMYFTCYLCLVVAITVLYSMIAVKLVQLKKQQKERMAAKYAGLRSSKLMFPSQDSLPLTNDRLADPDRTRPGEERQENGPATRSETEKPKQTCPHGVPRLHHLAEEIERRRSVTFRLPRKSSSSVEDKIPATAGKNTQNGVQMKTPEIIIDQCGDEDDGNPDNRRSDPAQVDDSLPDGSREEPAHIADDAAAADSLLQGTDLTHSTDSLQAPGCSDHTQLLPSGDTPSGSGSPEDTDEFEQGIHFIVHADLAWQNNPIVDPEGGQTPDTTNDGSKVSIINATADENGSSSSLLSDNTKKRAVKTWSDSFAALSVPRREGDGSGKSKVHRTTSDSNLVIPEKYQSLTSARRSFLMPSGGYPGGHTPTSRLPTPAEVPTPDSTEARPVPLSCKLLLERLNKKMAYRPAKTTRMLFAISIVFVISFLPFFCIVIIRAAQGRAFFATLTDAGVLVVSIFIRSSFISNAANPIIYGLCNKQFRTECGFLFKKCTKKRREVTLRVIEATDDVLGSNS